MTRVVLQKLDMKDLPEIHEAIEESRFQLAGNLGWNPLKQDLEQTQDFLEAAIEQMNAEEALHFCIRHKDTGRLLGYLSLDQFNLQEAKVHIGYWTRMSEARKGYMTEAVAEAIRFLRENLDFRILETQVIQTNEASQAVLLKNGFEKVVDDTASQCYEGVSKKYVPAWIYRRTI